MVRHLVNNVMHGSQGTPGQTMGLTAEKWELTAEFLPSHGYYHLIYTHKNKA